MTYLKTKYGKIPISELKILKFPDNPIFVLPNYLEKLIDADIDKPNSFIYIYYLDGSTAKIKFFDLSQIDFEKVEFLQIAGSPHKIRIPKYLTPKLLYLIGYVYGDGGFKDIRRSYL